MNNKKIIPCLDFKDGKVVKGVKFVDIKDIGDPILIAQAYEKQGADELAFLDITATNEGRKTMIEMVRRTAGAISIPLTVGGGISSVEDFEKILAAGAAKVSINSAAVRNKNLIFDAAQKFGSGRVMVAIDVKKNDAGEYTVVINGGMVDAQLEPVQWAIECEKLGAGEILLTSMDADGTKDGYDIDITKAIAAAVKIPVIASGGCGKLEDFSEVFDKTNVSAALAASIFHFGELSVPQVKQYLQSKNIPVNL